MKTRQLHQIRSIKTVRECIVFVVLGLSLIAVHVSVYSPITAAQDSLNRDYASALPRIAPSSPTDSLLSFELDAQLKIELLAAEPMVIDPVAIAFDEFGRAFVVEMRGYSEQGNRKFGRIRLLMDNDGDGVFDRSTVFAEGFHSPTAVTCYRGGILVGDAPNIWYLKDTDNDHRSDLRQVVFSGFGNANIQQLLNNFQWGIDNRIYGATGGNGGLVQRASLDELPFDVTPERQQPQVPLDLRHRDFAISGRTFQMATTSGGGQFGMTFDRWGNRFVCSNSDHCQQIVLEENDLAQNATADIGKSRVSIAAEGPAAEVFRISPVEPWRTVRTRLRVQGLVSGPVEGGGRAAGYFTSATGITVFQGDALPPEYVGNVFVGDVGSNLVHRKTLNDIGIVKQAVRIEQETEFLRSPDNWFRPVQMANAPDGSLIILDMCRENVEHPASLPEIIKKHLDLNSGNDRGRLYRIVPKEFSNPKRLLPGEANLEELVQMLEHSNGWHRQTAARLLTEKSGDRWRELIDAKVENSKQAETRIRAMHLLSEVGMLKTAQLNSLLQHPHPYVRIHALKLADAFADHPPIQKQIVSMADDPDIRVRFQVALLIGKLNTETVQAFAKLAFRDGDDRWMKVALTLSSGNQAAAILNHLILESKPKYDTDTANGVRQIVIELSRQLGRECSDADLQIVSDLLVDLHQQNNALIGEILVQLVNSRTTSARLAVTLNRRHKTQLQTIIDHAVDRARTTALASDKSIQDRTNATRILRIANAGEVIDTLPTLLGLQQPPEIRQAIIETANHFSDPKIADLIMDSIRSMDPESRRKSLTTLLSRTSWTRALLKRIKSGDLNPVFLDAAIRQRLTRNPDPQIRQSANDLLNGTGNRQRSVIVNEYQTKITSLTGDVDRGRILFRRTCIACHRLEDQGTDIGPSLVASANRGGLAILTNVLDPNREVDPRYLSFTIMLVDGRILLGIIPTENANSIVLRDAEGKETTIARNDIEEMNSTAMSLMPENLENEISPDAMADLIAYLLSQSG